MKCTWSRVWLTVVIATLGLLVGERPETVNAQQIAASDAAAGDEAETLLRGPLHEAFAGPIAMDPESGLIVPKKPPEAIEEIPPEAKPVDESVIWISGYWAWDEERDDFIYVSGVWRVPPADRRWVPGYWTEADGGYRWISGFWTPVETEELRYMPSPPTSLESGPTSPQPSSDDSWVSGCWLYRDSRYAWRPGYWNAYHDGWVWVPSHYVWTPHGAIFVAGYWDYPFPGRGVAFAPVYFSRPIYARSGYCYSPSVAVDISRALLHLFVYPRRCHYYWGDYYGYRPRGGHQFYTWYDYHGRHGYDPMFAYCTANYRRQNIDYAQRLRGWHDYFQRHEEYRPAHTLHAQAELAARVQHREPELRYALLGSSLSQALARTDNDGGLRLERIPETHRQAWKGMSDQMHAMTRNRVEFETGHNPKPRMDNPARPTTNAKPERRGPEDRLRLPELPQIAKVKSVPGAPRRWEDSTRTDPAKDANHGRGGSGRDNSAPGERPARGGNQLPETSRKPPLPDRSLDAAQPGRPDAAVRKDHKPRIEIPRPSRGPDTGELGRPDVRTPESRTPRIEIPKPSRGPDAAQLRQPDARAPDSRTPRTEIPKPSRGPDAAQLRQPDARAPDSRTPRIEIPKPSRGPDAVQLRQPDARAPDFKPAREFPQRSVQPNVGSTRSFEPSVRSPRVEPSRHPQAAERAPRIEIPRSMERSRSEPLRQVPQFDHPRTERSDRGSARPEFSRPETARPNLDPSPSGRDHPAGGGGSDRSRGRGRN